MNNSDRNKILALLFAGVFMGALDIGIVGPAFLLLNQPLEPMKE